MLAGDGIGVADLVWCCFPRGSRPRAVLQQIGPIGPLRRVRIPVVR
jgi:hypothetical protein